MATGKGSGLSFSRVKDIRIGTIYVEDCATHGLEAGLGGGGSNQVEADYLEVLNCGGRGLNLGVLADSDFGIVKAGACDDIGAFLSGANTTFQQLHCYLNKRFGAVISGKNNAVSHFRGNHNGLSGLRIDGTRNRVTATLSFNNGQDVSSASDHRAGRDITASARKNWVGREAVYDDQDVPTHLDPILRGDDPSCENTIGVAVTG